MIGVPQRVGKQKLSVLGRREGAVSRSWSCRDCRVPPETPAGESRIGEGNSEPERDASARQSRSAADWGGKRTPGGRGSAERTGAREGRASRWCWEGQCLRYDQYHGQFSVAAKAASAPGTALGVEERDRGTLGSC